MAATRPVRLIVFPGGFNWPVWVAQRRGFFARAGIEVAVTHTPGSVFQWTGLAQGDFDLAITLMDNVVAYREGQGEAPVTVPDAIAVMASDTGVLPALITQPDIRSYADLRGRRIAIDARLTGYALVLVAMLEGGGLGPEDYVLERAGGVQQRFDELRRGTYAAALFNSPMEGLLERAGFNRLDTAASAVERYQGQVLAVRRGWAEANRPLVVAFIRGFLEAVRWLYDPTNRDEAFAIFADHTPGAAPDAATTAHGVLFHPETGFPADGAIDLVALREVLRLRAAQGVPPKPLGEAERYYDPGFLKDAR
jgi:ABC-type nitrate/sulfonate/bicarbonate transport system substrate-binding protein